MSDTYECDVELCGSPIGPLDLTIVDALNGNETTCELSEGARLLVFGRATYVNDRPARIVVKRIKVMPTIDEHPGLYAVQGIDITGGMDAAEYVRSIRGEE